MSDLNKFVQTNKTTLFGSGSTSDATSIVLTSFKLPNGTTNITMPDFGGIGFATIEPGTLREEQISFTGITQNDNGTATLTGVTRGLRFVAPYDSVPENRFPHAGGSTFVITNTAGFYDRLTAKGNDETITGKYSFSTIPESSDTPLSDTDLATKKYVDDNVTGGEISINRTVVSGIAGQDIAVGNLVYLKVSDSKWWRADADLTETVDNVKLGIAQGEGETDDVISGGVLVAGIHTTIGLTANSLYYASNTAGGISTTPGTLSKVIGQSISTTQLHFDPVFYTLSSSIPTSFVTESAGASDEGKGVKLGPEGLLDESIVKSTKTIVYDTPTWEQKGDVTTRYTTTKTGSTIRYTWNAGTNPEINNTTILVGTVVEVDGISLNSNNRGTFTVTARGTNFFEVTNASGVASTNQFAVVYKEIPTVWTKQTGLKAAFVELYGGGGGGGGGYNHTGTSVFYAGAGGGGGAYNSKLFYASQLGDTETVRVAYGGAKGFGGSNGSNSTGSSGNDGGNTTFGTKLFAGGGGRGVSSTSVQPGGTGGSSIERGNTSAGQPGAPFLFSFIGSGTTTNVTNANNIGTGGAGTTTSQLAGCSEYGGAAGGRNGNGNQQGGSSIFAGAGGAGGGRSESGAQGGLHGSYTIGGGAAGGALDSGNPGGNGVNFGDGGGSGGANAGVGQKAGDGGNGNIAAGGGGGGSSRNDGGAGNGGNGGHGFARITEFY